MKQGLTELIVVIDTCFSVKDNMADQHNGLLKLLSNQRKQHGEMRLTIITQNSPSAVPVNKSIQHLKLSKQIFQTGGTCSFIDTCVEALDQIGIRYMNTPVDELPENVIFVVVAVDRDYASKQFTYEQLRDKLAHQRDVYRWNCFVMTGSEIVTSKLEDGVNQIIPLDTEESAFFLKGFMQLDNLVTVIRNRTLVGAGL